MNLVILLLAQLGFTSGSVLLVTIGGIVGSRIAPSMALATLPVSLMVVGTALATIPAALLMQRFGRRAGFSGSAVVGVVGSCIGAHALGVPGNESFLLFCIAALTVGITLAFAQQFRFAAAESVSPERAGQAVSFILLGSIGGALLGPELVARSAQWNPELPFRAALFGLAVLQGLAGCLLLGLRPVPAIEAAADAAPARSLRDLLCSPLFVVAVLGGMTGQGVMTFLMTATPVSMHVVDGHGITETAEVIRAHVVAMYLPSLVAAALITRLGPQRLMAVGALTMICTVILGLQGQEVMHYWFALVLLGVGWNFLFVGGTTLLVSTYRPSERFRAQALNDFSVFGTSALASLLAGSLLLQLGWALVLLLALPPLLGMLLLLWFRRERRAIAAP